ncbi:hypothetical protein F0185_01485 [Massilia sp. CCM 8692]|uniref:Uncharacterized protein n=1 Tax=Massilia rubra TaxID=2607910 RepID=A0ABX0LI75_9BURK|nr:hypothetical protein [Massilia rubra]
MNPQATAAIRQIAGSAAPWKKPVMKSASRNLKACAILITITLACVSGAHAADRVKMGGFSIAPQPGWYNKIDRAGRFFSKKTKEKGLPMLVLEACKVGRELSCPPTCDYADLKRLHIFTATPLDARIPVKRTDAYVEYESSDEMSTSEGKFYASTRVICGPAAFIYAVQLDPGSTQQARRDLEAVISTIKWRK